MAEEQKVLQDQVAELQAKLADSQKANAELVQEKKDLLAKLEKAESSIKDSDELMKELEVENAQLKAVAANQETEIKALSVKAQSAKEVITAKHEGKVYQILGGAQLLVDGQPQKLSAADIAASPELVAHLVNIESGLLKEVK